MKFIAVENGRSLSSPPLFLLFDITQQKIRNNPITLKNEPEPELETYFVNFLIQLILKAIFPILP